MRQTKTKQGGVRTLGIISAVLFIATVWLANWLLSRYGVVSIGFGLYAPAGVFAVGAALTLRDLVDRTLGRAAVVGCIGLMKSLGATVGSAPLGRGNCWVSSR